MHEDMPRYSNSIRTAFASRVSQLKIGIHNDITARHPELRPSLIASALKSYTRSLGYLEAVKAGAARIDLEGNPVGTVTVADEEDAKRKSAKLARRAAAKASEGGKSAGAPSAEPAAKSAGQQNPISEANSQQPTPAQPQRLGLADLKASAQARRARLVAAK